MRLNPAGGNLIDVTDRAGRLLGQVSPAAGAVWDVSDRVARVLGRVSAVGSSVSRNTAGPLNAPLSGTILADTGALAAGIYVFTVAWAGGTSAQPDGTLAIQHRDAANAVNVTLYPTPITANVFQQQVFKLTIGVNERVRVILGANYANFIHAVVSWERLDA